MSLRIIKINGRRARKVGRMDKNAITIIEAGKETLTAVQVRAQVNLIQEVMKSVMKKDTHYGTIPGCQKPTLYKAGAEVLATTFRLAVDPEVADMSTHDEIRYRVRVKLTAGNGNFVGVGIGEASSNEEKYMWRKAVCKEEFEATPEDRKRIKWSKGANGAFATDQVRTNIADIANTILKMAKKRAQIDAILTATAASDIFTQDIEDLPEEIRSDVAEGQESKAPQSTKPQTQAPQRTQTPPPAAANGPVISENQGKRFYAIAKGKGMTDQDMKDILMYECGVEHSRDIPRDRYDAVIEAVQAWKAQS